MGDPRNRRVTDAILAEHAVLCRPVQARVRSARVAAAVIDVSFLLLIATAAAREVIADRNWHNLPPIFIVLIFLVSDIVFHIEDYQTGRAEFGTRLGIAAAIALISLVGGCAIPSFTRNWLERENPGGRPRRLAGSIWWSWWSWWSPCSRWH